jgi:hypothetical protein
MKIQYASDLHIDGWPFGTPFGLFLVPASPFLVLAGDICSAWHPLYPRFLKWCSRHWHTVILVAGNHEYHNDKKKTIAETDMKILEICGKFKNVVYLQYGASYALPGTAVRVVGGTLWSTVDPAIWDEGAAKKGDCQKIFLDSPDGSPAKLHPANMSLMHFVQSTMLQIASKKTYPTEKVLVVTHYLPTKQLLEVKYRGEKWHSFYASDDDALFTSDVSAWICGHGHRNAKYRSPSGTRVMMNARGYNRKEELTRSEDVYDPKCIIRI